MKSFDLVVLGGGPGGYVAAIRAAQSGKKIALVEARDMGGTCLNWGCIPTKSLLAGAEVLNKVRHADDFGISVGEISIDFPKMVKRTQTLVGQIRSSLEGLIQSNHIEVLKGFGSFISPNEMKVAGEHSEIIRFEQAIIATGSEPKEIPVFPFDGKKIHSSSTVLNLEKLPKSMVIVGGGVIGCEFASLFQTLGVQVHIVEVLPGLIMTEGKQLSKHLRKSFEEQGIKVSTETFVEKIDTKGKGVTVHLKDQEALKADCALVAVGRQLNTSGIGLEKIGLPTVGNGVIAVNDRMETEVPGIYAIGDITAKWLLAHVASHQGIVAADNALGGNEELHYHAVPSVTFTRPEIASVGKTLETALEEGYSAQLATFPFQVLGKAQATLETEGFTQIVSDSKTGQILGAQVVGYQASNLIAEMALAIHNELTLDCIIETIHAHPTIAEAWLETALLAKDTPIHFPPKKKKRDKAHATK